MLPRAHARWEEDGTLADVIEIAQAADRFGYHHITCSEHVAIPDEIAAVRGGRYWDPLATFGYLAAMTERVRFATHVLVLGYHHPLEIAKRYGTLDQVTDGRLVLGVGVGSLEEEFALIGAPFADRGARADDAMRALRSALGTQHPEYAGDHYSFSGFVVDPCAQQAHVPLWVGGRTARSLRRAVEVGDGWAPFGLTDDEIGAMVGRARQSDAWLARATPIEVVLQSERPLDPIGEPARTREQIASMRTAGANGLNVRVVHHSRAHYLEQIEALPALAHT